MQRTLYRDPTNGKIAGVCAGIAQYLNLEIWVVRIVAVTAFLLGLGFFTVIAYVAAVLIIDKKPATFENQAYDDYQIKQKPWQQGKSAQTVLLELEQNIKQLEHKVGDMEIYVTSREYELNRQFRHL